MGVTYKCCDVCKEVGHEDFFICTDFVVAKKRYYNEIRDSILNEKYVYDEKKAKLYEDLCICDDCLDPEEYITDGNFSVVQNGIKFKVHSKKGIKIAKI